MNGIEPDLPPRTPSPLPLVLDESEDPPSRTQGSIAPPPPRDLLPFRRKASISPRSSEFLKAHFPGISRTQWSDWRWQLRHRITTLDAFEAILELSDEERQAFVGAGGLLPTGVTPYYLSLVSPDDPTEGLRRTVVPSLNELIRLPGEDDDPLGEDSHQVAPGVIHRYPDRVLFLALDFCPTYCRYCTRSRVVGHGEILPDQARLEAGIDYIRRHPEIRDVLVSGGDPLSLSDERLDWILGKLREIPHVQFLRIGTKYPAVLPQRITPQFVTMLRKHHPLWMSLHFMHPNECTPESYLACARLADAGIPLGSQTVLARGVNDDVETMRQLMHNLLMMRVRPYYLYQCDPISGSAQFRTSVRKGLEIIAGLRGHTTGYAVPTYVVDAPGGGGKIPLQPDYVVGWDGQDLLLRNFEGNLYKYPDPDPGAEHPSGASPSIATLSAPSLMAAPQ